jgi:hypothetical protein
MSMGVRDKYAEKRSGRPHQLSAAAEKHARSWCAMDFPDLVRRSILLKSNDFSSWHA